MGDRSGIAGLALGIALTAGAWWATVPPANVDRTPTRFGIYPTGSENVLVSGNQGHVAVSRDGRRVAFIVWPRRRLHVRSLEERVGRTLDGTDNASWPVFSPDGSSIAFFVGAQLRRISVSGGSPTTIGTVSPFAATWSDDNSIIVGQAAGGLLHIPANGGVAQPLFDLEPEESWQRMPHAVPGSDVVLYVSLLKTDSRPRIMAVAPDTKRRVVVGYGAHPKYSGSGHLLFGEGTRIMAAALDVSALALTSEPVRLLDDAGVSGPLNPVYDSSTAGTLAYLQLGAPAPRTLVWVDRQGRTIGSIPIADRQFEQPRLSPDGARLAVTTREPGAEDIWLVDLRRSIATRFSTDPGEDETPVWSPDGSRLFFKSNQRPMQRASDSSRPEVPLDAPPIDSGAHVARNAHLGSVSPDGKLLAVNVLGADYDIELVSLEHGKVIKFAASAAVELSPAFSPDGRWIAYQSDESGTAEIYLQAFPGPGAKWQVSKAGGTEPVWARSGTELFYRNGLDMMAVPVRTSPGFLPGTPERLFTGDFEVGHRDHPNYDVSPDGRRFLMIARQSDAPRVPVQIEMDLHSELRRLLPPKR